MILATFFEKKISQVPRKTTARLSLNGSGSRAAPGPPIPSSSVRLLIGADLDREAIGIQHMETEAASLLINRSHAARLRSAVTDSFLKLSTPMAKWSTLAADLPGRRTRKFFPNMS